MSLRVLSPGSYSLIVDGGRPRTRSLGVPVGGPADRAALMFGNALLGNEPLAPALEIALSGPILIAEHDVGLCLFGASFQMECDGVSVMPCQTWTLRKGQTLRIGGTPAGCRAYLCARGGLDGDVILSSRTGMAPIAASDVLKCQETRIDGRSIAYEMPSTHVFRCLAGSERDWFDATFFATEYHVTPAANRMGIRLEGPALAMPKRELVSEPVAPGTVQITNEGKPIVLGVDGQTIGGYPKIAHIISADWDALGQLRPGDVIRFQQVSEAEAEAASLDRRRNLRKQVRLIQTFCM